MKPIDLSEKPDHAQEARSLFDEAFQLSRTLPSRNEFARTALTGVELRPVIYNVLFEALRQLYAENLMLEPPPIPANLDSLDGIRWRDRLRHETARMRSDTLFRHATQCSPTSVIIA